MMQNSLEAAEETGIQMLWLLMPWSVRVIEASPPEYIALPFNTRSSGLRQKTEVLTPAASA